MMFKRRPANPKIVQIIGTTRRDFSDHAVARDALSNTEDENPGGFRAGEDAADPIESSQEGPGAEAADPGEESAEDSIEEVTPSRSRSRSPGGARAAVGHAVLPLVQARGLERVLPLAA